MSHTGKRIDKMGFSLIEVILALAILGVVGVSLMYFVLNSYTFSARTGNKTQASFLAQEKMETILSMPFDKLLDHAMTLNTDFSCPGGVAQSPLEQVNGFDHITRAYQIKCIRVQAAGYPVELLKVTVETFNRHTGKRYVEIISYVKEKSGDLSASQH